MEDPVYHRNELRVLRDNIHRKKLAELLVKQISLEVIFLAESENNIGQYVKNNWFDYNNKELILTNGLKDELLKLLVAKFPGSRVYFIENRTPSEKPTLIIDWS
jgi:hypothetical protein